MFLVAKHTLTQEFNVPIDSKMSVITLLISRSIDSISKMLIEIKVCLCAFLVRVCKIGKPCN